MSKLSLQAVLELVDKATKPLQDVMGGSKKTAEALKAQREELSRLNRTQGDISSFRRLHGALGETRKELAAAQKAAAQLAAEHAAVDKPTKAMAKAFEQAKNKVNQLKSAERDQTMQLQHLRQGLSAAGISTKNLSGAEADLRSRINQTTEALRRQKKAADELAARQRKLNDITKQYEKTRSKLDGLRGTAMEAGATAVAGGGAMAFPIKQYAEAEAAATDLQVAMMAANGRVAPEFAAINALANKLGNQLPGTTAQFQAMMTTLVKQGISFKDILGGVGVAAGNLAVVMKMPFEDAAEFAAKMQDATRTAAPDMVSLMDTIQRMYHLGVDSDNMLQGFKNLGPAMDMVKMKGLDGAKALAPFLVMLDQAGMDGGAAGNALRKIFSGGYDQGKINDALADLKKSKGINMKMDFTNGKGEFGGLDNMFKQLDKLKKLNTQDRSMLLQEIFGTDAEVAMSLATTIGKGKAGYDEVVAKMQAQADLQKRVNAQLGTLKNLWDAATGTFTNAMVNFGEAIAPELRVVVDWIAKASEKLGNWAKENPQTANTLMKIAAGIVILLAAFSALSLVLLTILGPMALLRLTLGTLGIRMFSLISIIKNIGSVFLWIGRLMMANPLFLAIGLLATAAYLIYRNWGPIKEFFSGIWSSITAGARTLWQSIKTEFSGGIGNISMAIINWSPMGLFYQAFAAVLSWFGIDLPSRFTGFGSMIMQGLANGIRNGIGSVVAVANEAAANIVAKTKAAFGIHSPSRVFAQMGAYNMQGLANGITANAGLPALAVGTASQNAINAFDTSQIRFDRRPPITAAKAAASTAVATPSVFSPTINVYPSAGMNEQQLAQMVAAEVAKLQNMQAASTRRSYSDQE